MSLPISKEELINLCKEGVSYFENGADLYIRPSIFCDEGFLIPEAKSSKLVITIFRAPMPDLSGFTAMLSSYRRPHPLAAPTLAKASCLYANTSLALSEAKSNGFDNVVMRDGEENIVEFGSANLFIVKSERVITPEWNKTFLNGITKQRVISLLKEEGAKSIRFLNLVSCPPGIEAFHKIHPDIPIITASIDARLNEQAYIVPGLGDAGDRYFGTV